MRYRLRRSVGVTGNPDLDNEVLKELSTPDLRNVMRVDREHRDLVQNMSTPGYLMYETIEAEINEVTQQVVAAAEWAQIQKRYDLSLENFPEDVWGKVHVKLRTTSVLNEQRLWVRSTTKNLVCIMRSTLNLDGVFVMVTRNWWKILPENSKKDVYFRSDESKPQNETFFVSGNPCYFQWYDSVAMETDRQSHDENSFFYYNRYNIKNEEYFDDSVPGVSFPPPIFSREIMKNGVTDTFDIFCKAVNSQNNLLRYARETNLIDTSITRASRINEAGEEVTYYVEKKFALKEYIADNKKHIFELKQDGEDKELDVPLVDYITERAQNKCDRVFGLKAKP